MQMTPQNQRRELKVETLDGDLLLHYPIPLSTSSKLKVYHITHLLQVINARKKNLYHILKQIQIIVILLVHIMDVYSSLRHVSEGLSFRKRVIQLNTCAIIK